METFALFRMNRFFDHHKLDYDLINSNFTTFERLVSIPQ